MGREPSPTRDETRPRESGPPGWESCARLARSMLDYRHDLNAAFPDNELSTRHYRACIEHWGSIYLRRL